MNDEKFEVEIDDTTRYQVGATTDVYAPREEKYKDMLYLVAYDICQPRRLRRVAKVCEDCGIRGEYSVFEYDLSEDSFSQLWEDLSREIDHEVDTILAYRVCAACVREIESMGNVVRPGKPLVYII